MIICASVLLVFCALTVIKTLYQSGDKGGRAADLASRLVDLRRGRPRLSVLALPEGKLAERCGFQILPRAKQFALTAIKNPALRRGINGGRVD